MTNDHCQLCNLWEPERGYQPEMANMGFCPMFNKRTRFNHGSQCTAHSALHSSNAEMSGAPEKRTKP